MKPFPRFFVFLLGLFFAGSVWGGPESDTKSVVTTQSPPAKVSLDLIEIESGFVFESDLNHGGSLGRQHEWQNEFEYDHRFHLMGDFYLRAGIAYDRYDFGSTAAPVPEHLQSLAGVIGLDYVHDNEVGAFLWLKPGFYTENDFGSSSFDIPISVGRIFVLKQDELYFLAGLNVAFLRGGLPVVPLAGVIYIPSKKLRLMGTLPEPRLIYSPNDKLDMWVGGELVGGSFRTDHNSNIVPLKLSGTQVDYEDYRAGVGLTYSPCDAVTLDFGGGYAIQRAFKFHRAGENYRTDPAPYLRFELKARF
jgi:hypothetical protein